jgi:hypothetical protein
VAGRPGTRRLHDERDHRDHACFARVLRPRARGVRRHRRPEGRAAPPASSPSTRRGSRRWSPRAGLGPSEFVLGARTPSRRREFVFLCVPTPQGDDGSADLSYIEAAAPRSPRARPGAVVVNKSTVPVGSTRVVERVLGRDDVHVVSNPEFLREGSAVHDFLNPDRVVIGADDQECRRRVAACTSGSTPVIITDRRRPRPSSTRPTLPGHQDLVRQRRRLRVRGRRRRRARRGAGIGYPTSASARVPEARPGLGRLLLPEGLAGLIRIAEDTATTSTCCGA